MTTSYTVLVNGETVYTGGETGAEREYNEQIKWIAEPGETISLRDGEDLSVKKASIGDDGRLVAWL